jgi:uncharacterized protein DUF1326
MNRIALAFVGLLAIAALALAVPPPASTTYDVSVDTIEGCSCPLFCACYFGPSADEHMCQFNNVYKFRKGSHYGNVDLSDQIVWMSGDLGGEWHKHPGPGMPMSWVMVTFDKKSNPAQRDAIKGVVGKVFPVSWKKMETREDSISWDDNPTTAHAKMASGMAEITLDKTATLRPDKTQPVAIKNLQYWFSSSNEGFKLAYSTHYFNGEPKFSQEHKNGFTIAWTAKGEIPAEGGKAGQP